MGDACERIEIRELLWMAWASLAASMAVTVSEQHFLTCNLNNPVVDSANRNIGEQLWARIRAIAFKGTFMAQCLSGKLVDVVKPQHQLQSASVAAECGTGDLATSSVVKTPRQSATTST